MTAEIKTRAERYVQHYFLGIEDIIVVEQRRMQGIVDCFRHTIFSFAESGVAIARIPSAQMLSRFMFAGACCVAVCLFVSFYWKISLHMTALGAAVAFIVLINIASGGGLFAAFIAALLAAGALGSARLKLGYHTLSQVAVGFATGFIVAAGVGLFNW